MKATITKKYGSPDVLEFEEMQKPTSGDNDVLIKIHAAAANAGD
jgi:NADPH:quinone reductase-like Zn-dependent oxidoreductase